MEPRQQPRKSLEELKRIIKGQEPKVYTWRHPEFKRAYVHLREFQEHTQDPRKSLLRFRGILNKMVKDGTLARKDYSHLREHLGKRGIEIDKGPHFENLRAGATYGPGHGWFQEAVQNYADVWEVFNNRSSPPAMKPEQEVELRDIHESLFVEKMLYEKQRERLYKILGARRTKPLLPARGEKGKFSKRREEKEEF